MFTRSCTSTVSSKKELPAHCISRKESWQIGSYVQKLKTDRDKECRPAISPSVPTLIKSPVSYWTDVGVRYDKDVRTVESSVQNRDEKKQ